MGSPGAATHSVLIESTTSLVNVDGSTCQAPQAPTSAMLGNRFLDDVERWLFWIGRRHEEQALVLVVLGLYACSKWWVGRTTDGKQPALEDGFRMANGLLRRSLAALIAELSSCRLSAMGNVMSTVQCPSSHSPLMVGYVFLKEKDP